jgi:hypothetical protein
MANVPEQIRALWEREIAIEPAPGVATTAQVQDLKAALDELRGGDPYRRQAPSIFDGLPADERADMQTLLARVLARAATIAYAAGERQTGHDWLAEATDLAQDDFLRAQLEAAQREPERYRMLVQGRYLIARAREGAARKLWKTVIKGGPKDPLAEAARDEMSAPRPITSVPKLARVNGIGTGFYGARDHANDGTYTTTHCFSVLWVPLIPLAAYRVRAQGNGYSVFAKEQLSGFARGARWFVLAAMVLGLGGYITSSILNDPSRLARKNFEAAIDSAHDGDAEAALHRLDDALQSGDLFRVDSATAQRAGAIVVELTAGFAPKPFTAANLDQANRLVARYQHLPDLAQGGAALDKLLGVLDGWITAVDKDPTAKLALLRQELEVGDATHSAALHDRVSAARVAAAQAQKDDPLAQLALLSEDPKDKAAMDETGKVLSTIVDRPSLLDDLGAEIDVWVNSGLADSDLSLKVRQQRSAGTDGRDAAEADGVTRAQLTAMQKQRPWDQRVGLALARLDVDAGKLEAGETRLRAFGAPGLLVRDARMELAQLALAQGKLDVADDLASRLLEARLPRFTVASAAFEAAMQKLQDRIKSDLDLGTIPPDLERQLTTASEDEQRAIVQKWMADRMENDPDINTARAKYVAYADTVPMAIFAGTVKLRRAQAMSGKERDAMLDAAEKAFLAVRTEAEGQPEFHLGLGEIYARLGKSKESEAEFKEILDKDDPKLALRVAQTYRGLGRVERSKEIAEHVYDSASSPTREDAAALLGVLNDDDVDESEKWFLKADQKDPSVKIQLLEVQGRRELRDGKHAECDRTFAEIARRYLSTANAANLTGYNNAAVAHGNRFECTGDPSALRDAETTLEQAYRASGEEPIVVGNLALLLDNDSVVRAVAKRVDTRTLLAGLGDASTLANALWESGERDAFLADLSADPAWRRGSELASHYEVLAPSSTRPYQLELTRAYHLRDETTAQTVLERMKHAKNIDTSVAEAQRKRWLAGEDDDKRKAEIEVSITHYKQVLENGRLSPHTRAAALYLQAEQLRSLGLYWNEADSITRAIAARQEAGKLWPALADDWTLAHWLVDVAGVRADAERWGKLRRERSAAAVLGTLIASNDPVAAKIRGSAEWAQAKQYIQGPTARPGADDLRLARLFGDAQAESRAKAVLDDKLGKMLIESEAIAEPGAVNLREDLDYLAKP